MAPRPPSPSPARPRMTTLARRRILALDLHAPYAGFAVIEGASHLVDWGMLFFTQREGRTAASAAAFQAPRLIARHQPDLIVLTMPANQTLARIRLAEMKRVFVETAERARLPVREVSREKYLNILGAGTRYDAAVQMTLRYPALAPRLPRRRKVWQPERVYMAVFDATAAGTAYILRHQRHNNRQAPAA